MEEKEEIKKDEKIIPVEKADNMDHFSFFDIKDWKHNIVTDTDAPVLYSRRVIYLFSCFFSVFTGGILL